MHLEDDFYEKISIINCLIFVIISNSFYKYGKKHFEKNYFFNLHSHNFWYVSFISFNKKIDKIAVASRVVCVLQKPRNKRPIIIKKIAQILLKYLTYAKPNALVEIRFTLLKALFYATSFLHNKLLWIKDEFERIWTIFLWTLH